MAESYRCGWHSGKFTCKDILVKDTLEIRGNMTFGNASTDTLTVAGIATFSAVTNHGTKASPVTIVKGDTNPLVTINGNVAVDQESGVTRSTWVRTKVSIAQGACSVLGIEAQCRLDGPATLGAGQFTGCWAYWEQSGTTALNTGNLSSAVSCTVEGSTDLTIDSGAILAGVVVDSSVHSGASNSGTFDGIYIKKGSGKLDFANGIEFTDCVSNAIFKVADDQTICSDDNQSILVDISGTANDGFIRVDVAGATKYIALYDTKTS